MIGNEYIKLHYLEHGIDEISVKDKIIVVQEGNLLKLRLINSCL
jgi:hypothetical protein